MIAFSHRVLCRTAVLAPLALAASAAHSSGAEPTCRTYRPAEAMTTNLGSKSALAYFINKDGACHVALLVSEKFDPEHEPPRSAARLNLRLQSGEAMTFDSDDGETLNIACGRAAAFLKVTTGPREKIASSGQDSGPMLCAFDARP